MDTQEEINELVKKIRNAHIANQFPSYIESIRFPHFKNLSTSANISFNFPLTVLIGINGSGKSSALHAIYGCPDRKSTGEYWFSTPLDPIKDNRLVGQIPSIIYTYKQGNQIVEVIKRRSGVAKGLDYWETSRPIIMYGMQPLEDGKRNPPIKKSVKFLDFRSELSAFDKFFHFGQFKNGKTITSKQDYLRKYSVYIKNTFSTGKVSSVYKKSSKKPSQAGPNFLRDLAYILGKTYSDCKIMLHNFYGEEGATVLFNHDSKVYSEAFAGRGEFAVVKLLFEISSATDGSLIILDEPEVSLHPLAQERLKIFLLRCCLAKKLQIVLSSHSSKIIEFLPDDAIKLFYEDIDGKFSIRNKCSYFEAFHEIGETINYANVKSIIVEDKISKLLIDTILSDLGGDNPLLFTVVYFPGGAEHAIKTSVVYSEEDETNKFLLLDGDKRNPHFKIDNFTVDESKDYEFLSGKIKEATGLEYRALGFRIDGNSSGGNLIQKINSILKFLHFHYTNIAYLPLNIPEEFLWDEEFANVLLSAVDESTANLPDDFKLKFEKVACLLLGTSDAERIEATHLMFIKNFVRKKNDHYTYIVDILKKFKLS